MEIKDILELKINNSDFDKDLTIKGYLCLLLDKLWKEEERFSGKRPFGNGGWKNDLYVPLVKAKVVKGSFNEDGWMEDCDSKKANKIIFDCIKYCFK